MLSSCSRISSVAHQLSCFGVGFSLCLFTWGLFLCLASFLWGKVSDLSAGPLLSACCDGLPIIFQFFSVVWLWILLSGLGDEPCGLLPTLFQAVVYHSPAIGPPAFPAICLLIVCWEISSLLIWCPFSNSTPLLCVSFQFLVYCSVLFFFCRMWGSQSAQGAMLAYPTGGSTMWHCCSSVGLLDFSQADLKLASGSGGSSPVLSV
jgi:hypothetical protein